MLTISIDDSAIQAALAAIHERLVDMEPVMNEIGAELQGRVSARFETQRDPSGHAWAPLAASTLKTYPKNGNHRILDRFGDLLGSLNYQADAQSVTVGFGKDYAVYHEFGTKNMPRRGLLMDDPVARTLTPEDTQTVLQILNRHLQA